ncbi:hypothetical protein DFQ05_0999 [Winogradskyella wandonensis]|uniref:Uncharacterized protein n=1 Tax=Winogradskyella wandonensis TaxID=1442586 RepID=A0A4R1KQ96_9FLAO|nr:hypothetical protein DFQ05_0999 [Winogradskyella wandonensis]
MSLCFLVMSCVAIDDYRNFWYRHDKRSTYFQKIYEPIDTLKINRLMLCKRQEKIELRRYKTEGNLLIKTKEIEKNIIAALKKHFSSIDYKVKEDNLTKYNCGFLNEENILTGIYKPHLVPTYGYNADITFEIKSNSFRDHYKDGFYGGTDLLDQDKHNIQFIIRIAIFYDDVLIYFDNYEHFVARISEIDKDVEYQMPHGVVVSLVNKSLMEYNKRLERNLK